MSVARWKILFLAVSAVGTLLSTPAHADPHGKSGSSSRRRGRESVVRRVAPAKELSRSVFSLTKAEEDQKVKEGEKSGIPAGITLTALRLENDLTPKALFDSVEKLKKAKSAEEMTKEAAEISKALLKPPSKFTEVFKKTEDTGIDWDRLYKDLGIDGADHEARRAALLTAMREDLRRRAEEKSQEKDKDKEKEKEKEKGKESGKDGKVSGPLIDDPDKVRGATPTVTPTPTPTPTPGPTVSPNPILPIGGGEDPNDLIDDDLLNEDDELIEELEDEIDDLRNQLLNQGLQNAALQQQGRDGKNGGNGKGAGTPGTPPVPPQPPVFPPIPPMSFGGGGGDDGPAPTPFLPPQAEVPEPPPPIPFPPPMGNENQGGVPTEVLLALIGAGKTGEQPRPPPMYNAFAQQMDGAMKTLQESNNAMLSTMMQFGTQMLAATTMGRSQMVAMPPPPPVGGANVAVRGSQIAARIQGFSGPGVSTPSGGGSLARSGQPPSAGGGLGSLAQAITTRTARDGTVPGYPGSGSATAARSSRRPEAFATAGEAIGGSTGGGVRGPLRGARSSRTSM